MAHGIFAVLATANWTTRKSSRQTLTCSCDSTTPNWSRSPQRYWSLSVQTVSEKIDQRRRQLHVHSVMYYHMDTSIVTDATFDRWAKELVQLHETNPKLVLEGYEWAEFSTWTGDTGMHLPMTDWAVGMAEWLLSHPNGKKRQWDGDASYKV